MSAPIRVGIDWDAARQWADKHRMNAGVVQAGLVMAMQDLRRMVGKAKGARYYLTATDALRLNAELGHRVPLIRAGELLCTFRSYPVFITDKPESWVEMAA